MIPLEVLSPSEVDPSQVVLTNTDGKPIVQVEGAVGPEFGCGNCGTVLVIGNPLDSGHFFLHKSILLQCSKCGAIHTTNAINGHFAGRRLSIDPV